MLSHNAIEAMAPDQSALAAAAGLRKPVKWALRARKDNLIWGECQGSGANPYRVVADIDDPGTKCTCPSRKFPCKHALALMWMFADDEGAFHTSSSPDWVIDWVGRRRKGSALPPAVVGRREAKSLAAAAEPPDAPVLDVEMQARRAAAAAKRAADTRILVAAGLDELEIWIADQLRTGLGAFVDNLPERCRRIAARLVDAKAANLAGRIDETPSRLLVLPATERIDAAIAELGKLALLIGAWRAAPDDAGLRREIIGSETRDELLANRAASRLSSSFEVLCERITTRRDGLVSVSTWLLNLRPEGQRFALLLDFFPASAGRRSGAFVAGNRFDADLVFYPARLPLRAVIVARGPDEPDLVAGWPAAPGRDPLAVFADWLLAEPWRLEAPLLLPPGRFAQDREGRGWWLGEAAALPLAGSTPNAVLGAAFEAAAGIWTGSRLLPLAGRSNWGRLGFDA